MTPYKIVGPRDRMIGTLLFKSMGLYWQVYNYRNGGWYFIGALDKQARHPAVESDASLMQRAKELAARRHEEVVI